MSFAVGETALWVSSIELAHSFVRACGIARERKLLLVPSQVPLKLNRVSSDVAAVALLRVLFPFRAAAVAFLRALFPFRSAADRLFGEES